VPGRPVVYRLRFVPSFLLQRTVDRTELGVELRSDTLNRSDDRKCDAAGDQAIFDRRRARLIGKEFLNALHTSN
jgi:hypothetical protein